MTQQERHNRRCQGFRRAVRHGVIAGTAVLAAPLPLAAHHSFSAEFDSTKEVRATGAVTEVEWQNPHAWIHLNVTELCERPGRSGPPGGRGGPPGADEAEAEWACRVPTAAEGAAWAFELGSPNGLMRQGWTRNSLQPGDVVTINGTRARDGSTNSNARNVTTADGKRLFAGSSENTTP